MVKTKGLSRHGELVLEWLQTLSPQDFTVTCFDRTGHILDTIEDYLAREDQLWELYMEPGMIVQWMQEMAAKEKSS